MENNNEKSKLEEAGAFWKKTGKSGTQFLTGKIKTKSGEEVAVIVFQNKYKTEGSNQPDYRAYFDTYEPPNADSGTTGQSSPPKTEQSEDIPF